MLARLALALAAIIAAFAITGVGTHQPETDGPESRVAADAVAVITGMTDGDIASAVPADFAAVMGYQPVEIPAPDGTSILVKPTGDCSSPLGATTFEFTLACQQHDLGYDLLRYAARTGGELGPWARRAIDDQLAAAMGERCAAIHAGPVCRVVAWLGDRAVQANSWRQGQGVPVSEPSAPYLVAGGVIALAAGGPPIASRMRARARTARPAAMGTAAP